MSKNLEVMNVVEQGKPEVNKLTAVMLDFLVRTPSSTQSASEDPEVAARKIARLAARRAATIAGTLALPPGPLGWLTILPEMISVWKIQAQMIADISALYGRDAQLTKEHMLYCLFRHSAAQVVRELVVQVGERALVRRVTARGLETMAQKIGTRLTQRVASKSVTRWLPIVGALGVGGYAYYDTVQIAKTAIALFNREAPEQAHSRSGHVASSRPPRAA